MARFQRSIGFASYNAPGHYTERYMGFPAELGGAARGIAAFAGVPEVFDLTVDHPLHNFIANGVLVHKKEPIETCSFPGSGERVRQYERCECPDGTESTVDCSSHFFAVCFGCPDAGDSDAGSEDAGTLDTGRFEEDGGIADGGE